MTLSTFLLHTPHQFLSTYIRIKKRSLIFGISKKIVIAIMNETEVALVQTSASHCEQHWVHQRKVQV